MNLEEFLKSKDYTQDEIEETIIRWQYGFEIPDKIKKDIAKYLKTWSIKK